MTSDELIALFEKHNDEFLENTGIPGRKDLAAFNKLNELVPGKEDIIAAAEHDEFFLSPSLEKVASAATEDDVIFLIRCGVRLDDYGEGFAMFA